MASRKSECTPCRLIHLLVLLMVEVCSVGVMQYWEEPLSSMGLSQHLELDSLDFHPDLPFLQFCAPGDQLNFSGSGYVIYKDLHLYGC